MHQLPYIEVPDSENTCWEGWPAIGQVLLQHLSQVSRPKTIITVECYPGTYADINMGFLKSNLAPDVICRSEDLFLEENDIRQKIGAGFMRTPRADANLPSTVSSFFDSQKLASIQATIADIESGIILIHGVGAHLVATPDILIYSDLSRYEFIQRLRRKEATNIEVDNREQDYKLQYAWSYFIDWPIGDLIKQRLLHQANYIIETNNWQRPTMVLGDTLRRGFELALEQPIAPSPFFDPELWEDQSSKSATEDLGVNFHLRLEEDNLLFKINGQLLETPAINLLYHNPEAFLGPDLIKQNGIRFPFYIQFFDHFQQQLHDINYYPDPEVMVTQFGKVARHQDYYFIVKARKNANFLAGVQEARIESSEQLLSEIQQNPSEKGWRELLHSCQVTKGLVLKIPSGIVHSTGTGCQALNVGLSTPFFRQHFVTKKAGKRPHLQAPPLTQLKAQTATPYPVSLFTATENQVGSKDFIQFKMIEGPVFNFPQGTNQIMALCIIEGTTAQLTFENGKRYQLQFGKVVLLPAGLQNITWHADSTTRALQINIHLKH